MVGGPVDIITKRKRRWRPRCSEKDRGEQARAWKRKRKKKKREKVKETRAVHVACQSSLQINVAPPLSPLSPLPPANPPAV